MYCEGGRSRTGELADQARPGIGRLALESGAPVVPVAILGSYQVRNWKRLHFPKVTVQYGPPLASSRHRHDPGPAAGGRRRDLRADQALHAELSAAATAGRCRLRGSAQNEKGMDDEHNGRDRHRRRLRPALDAGHRGGRRVLRRDPRPPAGGLLCPSATSPSSRPATSRSASINARGDRDRPHTSTATQSRCTSTTSRRPRRTLEERGVEFQGEILDTGVCHMAFFNDPDGERADAPSPVRAAGDRAVGDRRRAFARPLVWLSRSVRWRSRVVRSRAARIGGRPGKAAGKGRGARAIAPSSMVHNAPIARRMARSGAVVHEECA